MTFPFHTKLPSELVARAVRGRDGTADVAWTRKDVASVIISLRGSDVAILGGDVLADGTAFGGNWYSERAVGESRAAFVSRTHAETLAYTQAHPGGPDALFVLVFDSPS